MDAKIKMKLLYVAFKKQTRAERKNFKTIKCGTCMFINKEYPWLHATLDFISWCCEVKCPYCTNETDFEGYLPKSNRM